MSKARRGPFEPSPADQWVLLYEPPEGAALVGYRHEHSLAENNFFETLEDAVIELQQSIDYWVRETSRAWGSRAEVIPGPTPQPVDIITDVAHYGTSAAYGGFDLGYLWIQPLACKERRRPAFGRDLMFLRAW